MLAGSAAWAQQPAAVSAGSHWPPFTPAAPDHPAPPAPVGMPTVVLVPEHPTPVATPPAQPSPAPASAGGWQPNLPKPPATEVARTPMAPAPTPQTRPANQPYIRQMRLQEMGLRGGEEGLDYQIQLEVPGPDRLFRRESEQHLQMRVQQEARGRSNLDRISFPEEPVLSTEAYTARAFPPATEVVEPFYVCYGRLDFEQKNSERYGWDLGLFQPLLCAAGFYFDAAAIPYKLGSYPFRWWDCNTGYCLPGDPVPYLLYPPDITLSGSLVEAGTVIALFAIFPG